MFFFSTLRHAWNFFSNNYSAFSQQTASRQKQNCTSAFGRLRQKTASKNVPHSQYEFFFFSFNPSNHVFKSLFLSTVMFRLLKAALVANCVRIPLGLDWHEWFGDIRKRNKNVAKCLVQSCFDCFFQIKMRSLFLYYHYTF